MALFFNAAVNCGPDLEAARAIAAAFDNLPVEVAPGVTTFCRVDCLRGEDGFWHAHIDPQGAWYGSDGERPELMTREARSAIAAAIYERLRTCRGFLVAITGPESHDNIAIQGDGEQFIAPVVVREDLRRLVASTFALEPFSPGYLWAPPPEAQAPRP